MGDIAQSGPVPPWVPVRFDLSRLVSANSTEFGRRFVAVLYSVPEIVATYASQFVAINQALILSWT